MIERGYAKSDRAIDEQLPVAGSKTLAKGVGSLSPFWRLVACLVDCCAHGRTDERVGIQNRVAVDIETVSKTQSRGWLRKSVWFWRVGKRIGFTDAVSRRSRADLLRLQRERRQERKGKCKKNGYPIRRRSKLHGQASARKLHIGEHSVVTFQAPFFPTSGARDI